MTGKKDDLHVLPFSTVFSRMSEAEKSLAEAFIQYTLSVEKNVIEPLNTVVEVSHIQPGHYYQPIYYDVPAHWNSW